jgi:4-amino-4-deoxy-L-arabinose transferase-like glycosyltransferase
MLSASVPTDSTKPRGGLVFGLLLAVHLGCGLHSARTKTVTHDEIWHLPVGLLHWRTGEFQQDVLNPPLTRLWAAIPAAITGVEVNPGRDATDIAQRFVREHDDYRRWYVWGRCFNLVCSLLTAWIVYRWAGEWFGPTAAILAGTFFCTCPNIVAHSSLVTPDAGLMLGYVASLWLFLSWRSDPTWRRAVVLGIVLGLTQTTKFTAILLYPLLAVLMLARFAAPVAVSWRRTGLQVLAITGASLLVWNAVFLFRGTGQPLSRYVAESQTLKMLQAIVGSLGELPCPLPRDYVAGVDRQKWVMEQAHPAFLNGRWSISGFPDYFLRTLQYKLPHGLQLAVIPGFLLVLLRRGESGCFSRLSVLLLPTAALLGVASFSTMQLGVRYVLPALPLLMILASRVGLSLEVMRPAGRRAAVWLVIAVSLSSLRHHPHHLAYFNEAAGGPAGGRHHLLDSNLDWGQDLHLVREFMDQQQLDEIGLVYFGTLPAERLGIRYQISRGREPEPGWHAVSVNYVMGRPHLLREPAGTMRPADIGEFAYFQRFEPVARLGYSIDVYHIPAAAAR